MAEFEYYEDFECEEAEEEIVQELLKFGIYGEQTTLDGILEEAEKNLNDTKARVAELKTLFGDDENTDENSLGVVPGSSNEILASRNDGNMEDVAENTTSTNDSLHVLACKMDDAANKDLDLPMEKNTSSTDTPTTLVHGGNEATLDVSLPTLEASHHDDTGGEHKPDTSSNTDTPTTLVHGGNEATLDVFLPTLEESEHKPDAPSSTDTPTTLVRGGNEATLDVFLPTLEESHHDDTGGEHKPDAASNTDTPTTLVRGDNEATLDVFLPTLEASHHDDTGGEHKPDAPSSTDTPTTLVHGGNEATPDVFLPTITEPHYKEVQTASDVEGERKPVPDGSSKDSEVETVLVSDKEGEIKSSGSNSENNPPLLVDAHGVKNECSDVEVWNDGCPLPSSGPTYSEWQNTDDVDSSGAEAISTQVSTAGCLPGCEEPRSGCVNIESVMSSEQVAPSTSIIDDGTKLAGNEGFQNKIEDGEIVVTDSSLNNEDEHENGKCKLKKKSKEKKKAKVHKKEKRSKDGKAEKTKSKKFHRRLVSLFCCCFKSQERNNENNEMEQSTTVDRTHCEDTSQRHSSFVTIDLNI